MSYFDWKRGAGFAISVTEVLSHNQWYLSWGYKIGDATHKTAGVDPKVPVLTPGPNRREKILSQCRTNTKKYISTVRTGPFANMSGQGQGNRYYVWIIVLAKNEIFSQKPQEIWDLNSSNTAAGKVFSHQLAGIQATHCSRLRLSSVVLLLSESGMQSLEISLG